MKSRDHRWFQHLENSHSSYYCSNNKVLVASVTPLCNTPGKTLPGDIFVSPRTTFPLPGTHFNTKFDPTNISLPRQLIWFPSCLMTIGYYCSNNKVLVASVRPLCNTPGETLPGDIFMSPRTTFSLLGTHFNTKFDPMNISLPGQLIWFPWCPVTIGLRDSLE